jgi:hypothetical protein
VERYFATCDDYEFVKLFSLKHKWKMKNFEKFFLKNLKSVKLLGRESILIENMAPVRKKFANGCYYTAVLGRPF